MLSSSGVGRSAFFSASLGGVEIFNFFVCCKKKNADLPEVVFANWVKALFLLGLGNLWGAVAVGKTELGGVRAWSSCSRPVVSSSPTSTQLYNLEGFFSFSFRELNVERGLFVTRCRKVLFFFLLLSNKPTPPNARLKKRHLANSLPSECQQQQEARLGAQWLSNLVINGVKNLLPHLGSYREETTMEVEVEDWRKSYSKHRQKITDETLPSVHR
ncbi:hypothetical protein B0H63DRAFT_305139 [Podospora didyma]|uniref:Uncharacterized protein n=1 Tax=Podospora didyma TaxID=330526 RepID=A0AAE0K4W2_9PEZI|nr:hypothetical protein B0H63DRAFT_305139 [Podospora didyma]